MVSFRQTHHGPENVVVEGPMKSRMRSPFYRIFVNSLSMSVSTIGTMVLGMLAIPFIVHYAGLSTYGVWAVLSGAMGYFTLLDFGLRGSFVPQLSMMIAANRKTAVRRILSLGILMYPFLGVIFLPIALIVAPDIPVWFRIPASQSNLTIQSFWWLYAFTFISRSLGSLVSLTIARQKMSLVGGLNALTSLIYYGTLILFLSLFHESIMSFIWATYCSWIIVTIIYWGLAYSWLDGHVFSNPFALGSTMFRSLFRFAGWMQINQISSQINEEADRILIGYFVSMSTVGVYQIVSRLAYLTRTLPLSSLGSFLPMISEYHASGEIGTIRRIYIDANRYLALITWYIGGVLLATEPLIFQAWTRRVFPNADLILWLLIGTFSINNLTGIGTTLLKGIGTPRDESMYAALGSTLKVCLSLGLARPFGLVGILFGTFLGSTIGSFYFLYLLFAKHLHIGWWQGLFRWFIPLFSVFFLSVLSVRFFTRRWINPSISEMRAVGLLFLSVALFSGIFLLSLAIIRFFTSADIQRIQKLVSTRAAWKPSAIQGDDQ